MDLRVVILPVGRVEPAEVEAVAGRLAKVFHHEIETRAALPAPKEGHDPTRGQHLAGPFLAALRGALPRAAPVKPAASGAPDVAVFVTDVDLYRPQTEGVLGEIDPPGRAAVISVRRLREAFYKRKADPVRQRARLTKMALYAIGRIRGLPDCRDVQCAMATMTALADLDARGEKYCAACWRRLSTGAFRI
jgi:archaemetzincin